MKTIYLSNTNGSIQKFEYNDLSELSKEFKSRNIELGDECKLGDGCELGYFCKLGDGCKLKSSPLYAIGLYKYHVSAHINNGIQHIQLGCYLRTRDEWEGDFWNNPNEFTDHKSQESKRRKFAFKVACKYLDNPQ